MAALPAKKPSKLGQGTSQVTAGRRIGKYGAKRIRPIVTSQLRMCAGGSEDADTFMEDML